MHFDKLRYENGKPVKTSVSYPDLDYVRRLLQREFMGNDQAWAFEERKYENGKIGFSLKDTGNKIIIQIKQA